jgi:hypothetical protein
LTKNLAANSCQIFGRASVGINQTHPTFPAKPGEEQPVASTNSRVRRRHFGLLESWSQRLLPEGRGSS